MEDKSTSRKFHKLSQSKSKYMTSEPMMSECEENERCWPECLYTSIARASNVLMYLDHVAGCGSHRFKDNKIPLRLKYRGKIGGEGAWAW